MTEAARLDSWKDIAAYLKRDVSTVQRWEKREGMPVHRHQHASLGSVYAFTSELDAWVESRRMRGQAAEPAAPSPRPNRRIIYIAAIVAFVGTIAAVILSLRRTAAPHDNPLANAQFLRLTDFEGTEQAAVISRDGRFVAFLADREGPVDVWLTQPGTGQFHNLTKGKFAELVNPDIRLLGFSPDASLVSMWVRKSAPSAAPDISIWTVPSLGGEPKLFLEGAAEFEWSNDATRLVYHTPAPGDPMFVKDRDATAPRSLFAARAGIHNHYPVWAPDDAFIYFVMGTLPDKMDVWRVAPGGGAPARMTSHNSRVTHLTFLDRDTLLYLATDSDANGPWLYALDTQRRQSRRISFGVDRYTSISASADGRRLVATVANPRRTLWRIPIGDDVTAQQTPTRVSVQVVGGRSPRLAPGYLLYVSSRGDAESIWKVENGSATELWSGSGGRIIGGPSIAPEGRRIAFAAEEKSGARMYLMNADGTGVRALPESLKPHSAPAWSPDGRYLVFGSDSRLAKISTSDLTVTEVTREFASDPVWSTDGSAIVYSGVEMGTTIPIRAVRADGGDAQPRFTISRGVRHLVFLPRSNSLVVLRGDLVRKDFWAIDLDSGRERRLTNLGPDFVIGDFDISPDGREIVFDRDQDNSDIVLINR